MEFKIQFREKICNVFIKTKQIDVSDKQNKIEKVRDAVEVINIKQKQKWPYNSPQNSICDVLNKLDSAIYKALFKTFEILFLYPKNFMFLE